MCSLGSCAGAAAGSARLRGARNRRRRGGERRGPLLFPADGGGKQRLGELPRRRRVGGHHDDRETGPREAGPLQREPPAVSASETRRLYETNFVHTLLSQLIIVARDLGQPVPYETTQPLQVALLDIDDNEPVFLKPPVSVGL